MKKIDSLIIHGILFFFEATDHKQTNKQTKACGAITMQDGKLFTHKLFLKVMKRR